MYKIIVILCINQGVPLFNYSANFQVSNFNAKGIPAASLTGDQDDESVKSGIMECKFKLVYFNTRDVAAQQNMAGVIDNTIISRKVESTGN